MNGGLFLVIAFDIRSNRRRNRLVKVLKDFNGRRVNLSVFECEIPKEKYAALQSRINAEISQKKDSVLLYPLCANCLAKRTFAGIEPFDGEDTAVVKI